MNEEFEVDIDIRQLLNIIVERLWIIVVAVAVFVVGGLSYITITPKVYESTALLEVPQQAQRVVAIEEVTNQDFRSLEIMKTIEQNLQRLSLYDRVMQLSEVKENPLLKAYLRGDADLAPEELADMLEGWSNVRLRRGTRLIEVTVEHQVPEVARLLANSIVSEYVREMIATRTGTSQTAFTFLLEEAERVRTKLQKSESALQDYEKAVDIRKKIEVQDDQINQLKQRYREKHPSLIQAVSLKAQLENQFRQELLTISRQVSDEVFQQEQSQSLQGLTGQERIDAELKLLEARFNVLSREVETDRVLYDSIVTRMKETDVTSGIESNPVEIMEKARLPLEPSKPKKLLILLISGVAGIGIGFGLIVLLNLLDNTVKTVDQAERETELPVLSAIPDDGRIPDVDWMKQEGKRLLDTLQSSSVNSESAPAKSGKTSDKGKIEPLVLLSDSGSATAEAIRSLRASVKLLGKAEERKSILVTSAVPGEGKSFVSANLALAFAQEGQNTLLIDADLRRPMIDKIFNIKADPDQGGIVTCLAGLSEWEKELYDPKIDNLEILPVLQMAPNPAELLSGSGLEELMKSVSSKYDIIIIDSAPVNAVSDSLVMSPYADITLLVVQAAKTSKSAIKRARDMLEKAGRKPHGMVLNRLPNRSGLLSDPYYYYYSSGDGYGNVYGEKAK
ncbi:MAG: polysaccharide biosynthesis tyrosine autokinase [Verrucomicrobiota bacterium]